MAPLRFVPAYILATALLASSCAGPLEPGEATALDASSLDEPVVSDTATVSPGETPVPPRSERPFILLGRHFVQAFGCPSCHQSRVGFDGVLSGSDNPVADTMAFPSNLTPDKPTGIGAWSDAQLVDAIRVGVDRNGTVLCGMPTYATMGDVEVSAIIAYLRSLPAVERAIPASRCTPKRHADAGVTDAEEDDAER